MSPLERDIVPKGLQVVRGEGQQELKGRRELLDVGVTVTQNWLKQVVDR